MSFCIRFFGHPRFPATLPDPWRARNWPYARVKCAIVRYSRVSATFNAFGTINSRTWASAGHGASRSLGRGQDLPKINGILPASHNHQHSQICLYATREFLAVRARQLFS